MIKFFIGFTLIGTVLGGCSRDFDCPPNKYNNGNTCGGFLQKSCTQTRCCEFINNCKAYDCPSYLKPVDLSCSGNGCSLNYCCRQSCTENFCGSQKLDDSIPYCGYDRPFGSNNYYCNRNECCEEQQFCEDFFCPSHMKKKPYNRSCYKDCDPGECCDFKTCSNEGYLDKCNDLGKNFYAGKSCGSGGCTEGICCGSSKTCDQNGFDGDMCAGGMEAYQGGNIGNTGEECCLCGSADCTEGCDPNWQCDKIM